MSSMEAKRITNIVYFHHDKISRRCKWREIWGADSVGKVHAIQARGSEFNPQHPDKNLVKVYMLIVPKLRKQR